MKKALPMVLILIILLGGFFFIFRGRKSSKEPEARPTVAPLPISQKPYVRLIPTSDGHFFRLEIENIGEVAAVEYELIYLSNDFSRGVIGSIDLEGKKSLSREILLGSCSRNVCKYDENITSGTLTLRFRGSPGTQKYVIPFNLYTGTGKTQELRLEEGSFSFEGKLKKGGLYLVAQTVGLPSAYEGEVVAGPYEVFSEAAKDVSGRTKIKFEKAASSFKVLAWDEGSSSWNTLSSGRQTDGQIISVDTLNLTNFLVVLP